MTLTIEVPADVESALAAKTARLGVTMNELARRVVSDFARAPDEEGQGNGSGGFMAMLADSAPRIAAGARLPLASEDISRAIADTRADTRPSANSARQAARRALEALAAGTRAGLPPIPDEALTSESLYAGHGEIAPGEASSA